MEINETAMIAAFKPLLHEDEKSLCPIYGMVKKKVQRMTHQTSEYAYATITNKGRFLLYRFDEYSSRVETYEFITLMMGEISITQTGQYIAELTFLTDMGSMDVNMSFAPKVKDKVFPHQEKNAANMYKLMRRLTGDEKI